MASQFIKLPVSGGGGGGGSVDSFNGRTGVVVSQAGDYSAGIVSNTPAGDISATDVQAAINELDAEKQAVITGAASTITSVNLATDRAVITNGSGKIAVSPVTSAELGYVSGVTSAIQTQLDNKQPLDADLTAIAGLASSGLVAKTGAGTAATRTITGSSNVTVTNGDGAAGNPTLDLSNTGVTAGSYTAADIVVDAKGRIVSASSNPGPVYNQDLAFCINDDFTGSAVTTGSYGFQTSNAGTGATTTTGNTTFMNTTQRAMGVAVMTTGTTTTGRTMVFTASTAFVAGYAQLTAESRLWLPSTGLITDPFEFTFGFIDNNGGTQEHTDGAYFRFLGNGTNINWEIVTSAANVRTTTTTSSPVLINNPQVFSLVINEDATLVQFFIDGVSVGSHTTNIPNAGQFFGYGWKLLKASAGTTAQLAYVDWGTCKVNFSAPRG
jgi:hypothetical protein